MSLTAKWLTLDALYWPQRGRVPAGQQTFEGKQKSLQVGPVEPSTWGEGEREVREEGRKREGGKWGGGKRGGGREYSLLNKSHSSQEDKTTLDDRKVWIVWS